MSPENHAVDQDCRDDFPRLCRPHHDAAGIGLLVYSEMQILSRLVIEDEEGFNRSAMGIGHTA